MHDGTKRRSSGMKKALTTIGVLVAALTFAGVAAAATPQGKLTGGATLTSNPLGIHSITVVTTIVDGETVDVAKNNDRTGDCDGDSGKIKVTYGSSSSSADTSSTNVDWGSGSSYHYYYIHCAHYTGDLAMMVDYYDSKLCKYVIFRVKDRPTGDSFLYHTATTAAGAMSWVNLGTGDSGNNASPLISTPMSGDFSVTP
jgi:hypothetical protein